jgi:hypothetical protein
MGFASSIRGVRKYVSIGLAEKTETGGLTISLRKTAPKKVRKMFDATDHLPTSRTLSILSAVGYWSGVPKTAIQLRAPLPDDPMAQSMGHSVMWRESRMARAHGCAGVTARRIAVGQQAGCKLFTLQTLPTCELNEFADTAVKAFCFSLHAPWKHILFVSLFRLLDKQFNRFKICSFLPVKFCKQ